MKRGTCFQFLREEMETVYFILTGEILFAVFLDKRLAFNLASTFRSKWENQFDPAVTVTGKFYKNGVDIVTVPMMKVTAELEIAELAHLDAKAISIPLDVS